ncbi:MAG: BamA/TamA family outer membrane protein [Candidatus Cloacimonetes bacterium]|nr:BamA/TamA family outer membrane protein [Candidatus Cloacimonadota bacterium]MDD4231480.1 BamA/TamA family outer membrane protein [Candidatus Cloacimonadota bacterium]
MRFYLISTIIILCLLMPLGAELTFTAYPYLAYSSETRAMIGAFTFIRYDFARSSETESLHQVALLGNTIYSQNKQFMLALIPNYTYGKMSMESSLLFSSWPSTFYGTGNFTEADVSESFTSTTYSTESSVRYYLAKNILASMQFDYGKHQIKEMKESGFLNSYQMPGKDNEQFAGIGGAIIFDTTSGGYYPEKGIKLELKQIWYESALGSDRTWQKKTFDTRIYVPWGQQNVFAVQSDLEINSGDVPFYMYSELGKRLRAYDTKRFIDELRLSQRIEQRSFPFSEGMLSRLGFVVFAETGQVAQALEDVKLKHWHLSLGTGIRFSILPAERLNLRADIGFGKDSINFIINAREVF